MEDLDVLIEKIVNAKNSLVYGISQQNNHNKYTALRITFFRLLVININLDKITKNYI